MPLTILFLVPLWAQVNPPAAPLAVPSQPSPAAAVVLTLRLPDGQRQFRPGEIIPVVLEFISATPNRFTVDGATYDRSGRLLIDDFVIDRIDDVSDPMLDYTFRSIAALEKKLTQYPRGTVFTLQRSANTTSEVAAASARLRAFAASLGLSIQER